MAVPKRKTTKSRAGKRRSQNRANEELSKIFHFKSEKIGKY